MAKDTSMGRLEFTNPREAWGGEATDFTPKLAQPDMLDYLGDAIGVGQLTPIEVEHATAGNRSLDILAETADGRRVSIENQYGRADHDHLTRGLAYAVATGSRVLIVVAEGHRDEFVSVANYLNEVALLDVDHSILVWLVDVRAVRRVGDTIWSPEFVVRAEPNEWQGQVAKSISPKLSGLDDFYEKCESSEFAEGAQQILAHWLAKPGAAEGHDAQKTVALFHRSPLKARSNVAQISVNGTFTVTRGYIRDSSGLFEKGEETPELDERIRQLLPDARWTDAAYYITGNAEPEAIVEFLDWIASEYSNAIQ